jgi:hypothetical protein
MNASNTVTPKRRGRPATGRDPTLTVRFPPELLARVEAWADEQGTDRSSAIRRLVHDALDSKQPDLLAPDR